MNFTTIHSEGALFSEELIKRIAAGDASLGQKATDFGLEARVRVLDEIADCWSDARAYWDALQRSMRRLKEGESGVSKTRNLWVMPLLTRLLGFDGLVPARSSAVVSGLTYFISHRLSDAEKGLPVHIVSVNDSLDKRSESGRPRLSPHGLMQDYLNRTDHVWGLVTNGGAFRVVRNSARMSRPTYLEFDLRGMMESENFAEFQVFYRLVHRSRWPQTMEMAADCWLEKYHQQSLEEGGRVREKLRGNVEQALRVFGNGFLKHPDNNDLRDKIKAGRLAPAEYYRQLLRLVYRFIFLMVTEERKLVGPDPKSRFYAIYRRGYSITALRDRAERRFSGQDRFADLWEGVKQTFRSYEGSGEGQKLGVAPLNGDLFGLEAIPALRNTALSNRDLLYGFACLSMFEDQKTVRRINYGYLDVEEFGSVYESLLELKPEINDKMEFGFVQGSERRSTGSYYTAPELVKEVIDHALVPVMEDRLAVAKTKEEKEKAVLRLRICDLAAGSGHFLLAAARRVARELARIRSGEEEPPPGEYRHALREVILHCVYAVDRNPLAVDLCKVALWIEGQNAGLPLGFLDHHIKCGDSLVGVSDLKVLSQGVPDEAYKPFSADEKAASILYRKRNKAEREGQASMVLDTGGDKNPASIAKDFDVVASLDETTPADVKAKEDLYESLRQRGTKWWDYKVACDLWTYAFFAEKRMPGSDNIDLVPTTDSVRRHMANPGAGNGRLVGNAVGYSQNHPFFHWALEFPEVFETGGFDVVLGNPPFMGGLRISENFGDRYRNYLTTEYAPASGTADLCGFFFRRAYGLIKEQGHLGLVATNTISQGDTRAGSLAVIVNSGGSINLADRFIKWPGAANVEVNLLCIHKGRWAGACILDMVQVPFISSLLDKEQEEEPERLSQNEGKAFIGSYVRGLGFVIQPQEAHELVARDARNGDCLMPYLNGEDINLTARLWWTRGKQRFILLPNGRRERKCARQQFNLGERL